METTIEERPLAPERHRYSVDEYHRMGEAGVFGPQVRVELIDGEVIDRATIGTRHASRVALLARAIERAIADRAIMWPQNPIRLDGRSELQPDLAVLKWRADYYAEKMPTAADTLLVIEVTDTSARYDREIKLPLYARAGVPEVWIVDLDAGLVRFFRKPNGDLYTDITATETPGLTPIGALQGVAIDLSGVLA